MADTATRPEKAKTARAEKGSKGKTLTWRGVKLKLPAPNKMPGSLLFDFHQMQANQSLGTVIGLIESFIGEEQLQQIRQQVIAEGLAVEETIEAMTDLLTEIFTKYGMAAGESEASQGS